MVFNRMAIALTMVQAVLMFPTAVVASPELLLAVSQGHIPAVKVALKQTSDINYRDDNGYTALHWAAYNGHIEIVRLLLSAGANPDIGDNDGLTPLMLAAHQKHLSVVTELVKSGADTKRTSREGFQAHQFADGHPQLEKLLSQPRSSNAKPSQGTVQALDAKNGLQTYLFGSAVPTHLSSLLQTGSTPGETILYPMAPLTIGGLTMKVTSLSYFQNQLRQIQAEFKNDSDAQRLIAIMTAAYGKPTSTWDHYALSTEQQRRLVGLSKGARWQGEHISLHISHSSSAAPLQKPYLLMGTSRYDEQINAGIESARRRKVESDRTRRSEQIQQALPDL